jgi:hypothetical protein
LGAFEYRPAEEIRDAFSRHGARYLFLASRWRFCWGFPDTTQEAVVFLEKSAENGCAVSAALRELGFHLNELGAEQVERGKDFVQLKNGPFDLDLIFAPDGIETFAEAWQRQIDVEGFPVCHIDDIIASKEATKRSKDVESLPRLRAFRDYWIKQSGDHT